jgi:transcriptional regulator with GAF, ATPase, and Fis domain
MGIQEKIDIDVFKVVTRAIAQSDSLDIMTDHLSQLLVGSLRIKGCSIFALNVESEELEILGGFGLSIQYLNKGPLLSEKSIAQTLRGEPIVISDISKSDLLQYPQEAKAEGIQAIVSLPIKLYSRVIGEMRLYHHEVWEVSQRDLDSMLLLSEIIGLGLMYTRLLNALQAVKETVNDIHTVWLDPHSRSKSSDRLS